MQAELDLLKQKTGSEINQLRLTAEQVNDFTEKLHILKQYRNLGLIPLTPESGPFLTCLV